MVRGKLVVYSLQQSQLQQQLQQQQYFRHDIPTARFWDVFSILGMAYSSTKCGILGYVCRVGSDLGLAAEDSCLLLVRV